MSSESDLEKHTLTYRTVRGIDIQLDYVLPQEEDSPDHASEAADHSKDGKAKLPIVIWFHGGGLVQGSRRAAWLYRHLASAPTKYGICLISADYRLAPQTRMPGILSDLTSLFTFVASDAFAKATRNRLDVDRIVTVGSSAGGWLSLLAGLNVGFEQSGVPNPVTLSGGPVKGVVGIYPITSVEHEFWHAQQRPVSYYDRVIDEGEMKRHVDPNAGELSHNHDDEDRNKLYTYMIQEGILENLLLDGTNVEPSAFTVAKAIAQGRTVEPVPPVYLVHGTADDKVPHSQSVEVVEALRARRLECEYEERPGLDHSFDFDEREEMKDMWTWIVDKLK